MKTFVEQSRIALKGTADEESDLIVPLVDTQQAGRIYDSSLLRFALWGAVAGGFLLGWLAYGLAAGSLPVMGLGPFSAGGNAVAIATGGGIGMAVGALAGSLVALYRMPKRPVLPSDHASKGHGA